MEINVLVADDTEGCPEPDWLEEVTEKILTAQGASPSVEVGLAIVSQEKIRQLNLSYLGEDSPTDVLSFPMLVASPEEDKTTFVAPPDDIKHLGEVIISCPQAAIQAKEHGHSLKKEIATLIIHGILHLLGYDHDTPDRVREMRSRDRDIWRQIDGEPK